MMTKDQILDAAAQIFRKKGFHAASMQDIAEAVNLQKASLYHHISSKQEILLALLDRALDLLIEKVSAVAERDLPADEKLREMMRVYLKTLTDHADLAAVLLLEHRSLTPELHAQHVPYRDRFESLWRETIQDGLDEGIFCCADAALAARGALGIANWTITWYRPDGALDIEDIAEQYADMFLDGLRRR
jgi:AcrR family transcriptional regulator